MSTIVPINPKPFIQNLVGSKVNIRLKWGETEYHGDLVSVDSYMNIQLRNTEEFIAGKSKGVLGEVLIRCNNVLWISGLDEGSKKEDTEMSG
ncbi:uncharacterized protein PV09_02516 [Verruconis gallopava]|uniref:Sm protein F n=1 Tax=Verruconis gallopava TaxID=253628 RepID=A0A0D1XVL5_9PEZI|nr:uncharacterized protein PV09_02516 [Verruconis gallopava]KIW06836.1 hypothetical protein PV09_02516 [Verruconis gallopava]